MVSVSGKEPRKLSYLRIAKAMPVIVSLENFFSRCPSAVVVCRLSVSTSCFSDVFDSMIAGQGESHANIWDWRGPLDYAFYGEIRRWSKVSGILCHDVGEGML
jgi:hypothetical protein